MSCRAANVAMISIRSLRRSFSQWTAVIGLEIHAQINSKTKLFSLTPYDYEAQANTLVSLFDLATPGTMPVLNKRCVEAAVLTGIALNCDIAMMSTFDRKHYFYADQPAGYQITQHFHPIASQGFIDYYVYDFHDFPNPVFKKCRISRLQLEQDTGKTLNDDSDNVTWIDLNRCGVGLMEIVTDHTISSGLEAACLVRELQILLQAIGTCQGRMERGELRVDANVSVRQPSDLSLRTRTEVKNLNSLRFIRKALGMTLNLEKVDIPGFVSDYEIARHIAVYEGGGKVINETLSFDIRTGVTVPMRDKEVRQDYRYMPEPNLPPLRLYSGQQPPPEGLHPDQFVNVDDVKALLPSLPYEQRNRWLKSHNTSPSEICQILGQPVLKSYYGYCVDQCGLDAAKCADVLLHVFPDALKRKWKELNQCRVKSDDMATLIRAIQENQISAVNFKKVIRLLQDGDQRNPEQIIADLDLGCLTDREAIEKACRLVLSEEGTNLVQQYRKGKSAALKGLLKAVDNRLNHRASKQIMEDVMKELLNSC